MRVINCLVNTIYFMVAHNMVTARVGKQAFFEEIKTFIWHSCNVCNYYLISVSVNTYPTYSELPSNASTKNKWLHCSCGGETLVLPLFVGGGVVARLLVSLLHEGLHALNEGLRVRKKNKDPDPVLEKSQTRNWFKKRVRLRFFSWIGLGSSLNIRILMRTPCSFLSIYRDLNTKMKNEVCFMSE